MKPYLHFLLLLLDLTSHIQLLRFSLRTAIYIRTTISIISHSVNDFTAAVIEVIPMQTSYILHTHTECLAIFSLQVVA